LEFSPPDEQLRKMLWDKLLPSKLPLSSDVDTTALSKDYSRFTGGNIMKVRNEKENS